MQTVNIKKTKGDYYTCPRCKGGFITRAFNRCVDCGARIKWTR